TPNPLPRLLRAPLIPLCPFPRPPSPSPFSFSSAPPSADSPPLSLHDALPICHALSGPSHTSPTPLPIRVHSRSFAVKSASPKARPLEHTDGLQTREPLLCPPPPYPYHVASFRRCVSSPRCAPYGPATPRQALP